MAIKKNIIKEEIEERIQEYLDDIGNPEYIIKATPISITIKVSDWQGSKDLEITIEDVLDYYEYQAHNISSGGRTIAGHFGDWRPIDELASLCLYYFKFVNFDMLDKLATERGMHLKK